MQQLVLKNIIRKDVSLITYHFSTNILLLKIGMTRCLTCICIIATTNLFRVKWKLRAQFYNVAFLILKIELQTLFLYLFLASLGRAASPWPLLGYFFVTSLPTVRFCSYFPPCIWLCSCTFLFLSFTTGGETRAVHGKGCSSTTAVIKMCGLNEKIIMLKKKLRISSVHKDSWKYMKDFPWYTFRPRLCLPL